MTMRKERIYLFDTTLRDGQQTQPRARSRAASEDAQTMNCRVDGSAK